jgi:hypothetical protein
LFPVNVPELVPGWNPTAGKRPARAKGQNGRLDHAHRGRSAAGLI